MQQLTKEEALVLFEGDWWVGKPAEDVALFQLTQDRLCMPFGEFHRCAEEALGRPVFTHEFGLNREGLLEELKGDREPPSLSDILAMIPEDKRVIIIAKD